MIVDTMTIDMIEHGIDRNPTCQCGRPTTAVMHGNTMWIECSLLSAPSQGRIRNAMIAMTSFMHHQQSLGEVSEA